MERKRDLENWEKDVPGWDRVIARPNPAMRTLCALGFVGLCFVQYVLFSEELAILWQDGLSSLGVVLDGMEGGSREQIAFFVGPFFTFCCVSIPLITPRAIYLQDNDLVKQPVFGVEKRMSIEHLKRVRFQSTRHTSFVFLEMAGPWATTNLHMSPRWTGVSNLLMMLYHIRPDAFPEGFPESQNEWMRRAK